MPKFAKFGKRYFVYIFILLIGIEIGILFSSYRHAKTDSSSILSANSDCSNSGREPTAIVNEPKEEILGAPKFKDAGVRRSTVNGWIHVRWHEVKGAKSYNVRVWNEAGVEVKNYDTIRSFAFLKKLEVDPRLKETPYTVVVTPIGEGGVRGKDSDKKRIAMTPLRNLEPPTIKSIQTEVEGDTAPETPKTEITN